MTNKLTYATAIDFAINAIDNEEVIEKLSALKAQLAKKSSAERKPTATQRENVGFKDAIVNGLEPDKTYTITDIIKAVPEVGGLSNQRVSALVRQLVADGILKREEIKRKAYFSLA